MKKSQVARAQERSMSVTRNARVVRELRLLGPFPVTTGDALTSDPDFSDRSGRARSTGFRIDDDELLFVGWIATRDERACLVVVNVRCDDTILFQRSSRKCLSDLRI